MIGIQNRYKIDSKSDMFTFFPANGHHYFEYDYDLFRVRLFIFLYP